MPHFEATRDWIARQMCPNDPPPLPGPLRVSVLTSCTADKKLPRDRSLKLPELCDFRAAVESTEGRERMARTLSDLQPYQWPAEELYTGQQHRRLMRAVHLARQVRALFVDVHIVSAAWGIVAGNTLLPPYNASFSDLRKSALEQRAEQLGLRGAFSSWLARPDSLKMLLLGDAYLDAVGLTHRAHFPWPTIMLCSPGRSYAMNQPNCYAVGLGTKESSQYHCGVVALKGEVAGKFLLELANNLDFRARVLFAVNKCGDSANGA